MVRVGWRSAAGTYVAGTAHLVVGTSILMAEHEQQLMYNGTATTAHGSHLAHHGE